MNADPLVLLPGMNCSAALWSRLELPDGTIYAELTEPTLDAQIDRLLDLMPERFGLAGLSLGAVVAMALIRRAPGRVSSVTLMCTNPYGPTTNQLRAWRAAREALAGGRSARDLQADWLPSLLSPRVLEDRADVVGLTLQMADDVGEAGLDAQLAMQATRSDERPGLRDIRCPVRVVAARDDRLCSVARHEELVQIIPGAQLAVLSGCAHLAPLEKPAAVRSQLVDSGSPGVSQPTSAAPSARAASLA